MLGRPNGKVSIRWMTKLVICPAMTEGMAVYVGAAGFDRGAHSVKLAAAALWKRAVLEPMNAYSGGLSPLWMQVREGLPLGISSGMRRISRGLGIVSGVDVGVSASIFRQTRYF